MCKECEAPVLDKYMCVDTNTHIKSLSDNF